MSLSNYQGNVYSYDLGLGIEPEIIEYMKESHLIQSRVSPTHCYLLQQLQQGLNAGSSRLPITVSSYVENTPNYRATIWSSGSYHPDIRPYSNQGSGSIIVFIDGVKANRIHEVEDLLNDNEFAVVKRVDLLPARVELVFNTNFNASLHTVTYYYTTMDQGINVERVKAGEAKDSPQTLFGWQQYLDYTDDPFKYHHQILVRTPLTTANLVINEEGKVMMEDNQCWMIWEPYVKDFDILIVPTEDSPTGEELRYIIENKQDSKVQGQLVSQRFKIKQLEKTDDRYKITYITEADEIIRFQNIVIPESVDSNVLEKSFTFNNTTLLIGSFGKTDISIFRIVIILNNFTSGTLSLGSQGNPTLILDSIDVTLGSRSFDITGTFVNDFDVYLTLNNISSVGSGKVLIYYL